MRARDSINVAVDRKQYSADVGKFKSAVEYFSEPHRVAALSSCFTSFDTSLYIGAEQLIDAPVLVEPIIGMLEFMPLQRI